MWAPVTASRGAAMQARTCVLYIRISDKKQAQYHRPQARALVSQSNSGVPHHHAEGGGHDPTRDTGARRKVRGEEGDEALGGGRRVGVGEREFRKVEHVSDDVDDGAEDDGPGGRLVEGDVLVEGDDVVEGRAAQEGDEVPADGEENEDDIDMEDKCGGSGDGCRKKVQLS